MLETVADRLRPVTSSRQSSIRLRQSVAARTQPRPHVDGQADEDGARSNCDNEESVYESNRESIRIYIEKRVSVKESIGNA